MERDIQPGFDLAETLGSKLELKFPEIERLLCKIFIKSPVETINSCKVQLVYIPEDLPRARFITNYGEIQVILKKCKP